MKRKWLSGRKPLWFVFGPENAIWLSTASFTKRGSMTAWETQQPDGGKPWRFWYRQGFRCQKADLKYALIKSENSK